MGALGGLTGTAGGVSGTGISGPRQATIRQGTTAQDVMNAQQQTGNTMEQQQALLQALQGQNGLGRQESVANQQQALANQLGAGRGIAAQNQALAGLQNTAGMYGDIAQGRGPNPAQAALNQSTGQNVANQAALMAGQRGAGANAGLIARQAAMQGANTQQQAVGQAATLQAQQQMNALAGLTSTQQALGNMGGSQVQQQQAQQQAMANQANQMAGQQIGAVNTNAQQALNNQTGLQNALAGINTAKVSSQNSVNAANAALAGTQMQGQQAMIGGAMQGAAGGSSMMAAGGEVKKMAAGGFMDEGLGQSKPQIQLDSPPPQGATSSFGQILTTPAPAAEAPKIEQPAADAATGQQAAAEKPQAAEKPTEQAINFNPSGMGYGSQALQQGAAKLTGMGWDALKSMKDSVGDMFGMAAMAAEGGLATSGGHVNAKNPGQKAVKSGDSYDNDKIPAKLSEGEIVLPRSVTMSEDPVGAAADFVAKVLAKRKVKK